MMKILLRGIVVALLALAARTTSYAQLPVVVVPPSPVNLCGPLLKETWKPVKIKRHGVSSEPAYAVLSTHVNWALVYITGLPQQLQMECVYLDFNDA